MKNKRKKNKATKIFPSDNVSLHLHDSNELFELLKSNINKNNKKSAYTSNNSYNLDIKSFKNLISRT